MELRVLRYFLAVAREGNITAAANFLHLTQPTLSRQIKDLEEELGQQLLIRKSHRIALTPEGMLLRKRAEEIISMVDKTEAEFSSMEGTISGDIYIGGGETQAIRDIAEVIRDLRVSCPGVHCHLYSGNEEEVTERLDKGLLDFGILKDRIEKKDLMELPLICSRQAISPHLSGNKFADWFGDDFGKLDIVTTFNLVYNAAIMVKAGVGYALSLDNLADTSADSDLCFRPLYPRLESGLNLIWKKYQIFSPAADLFLKEVQDRFQTDPI